MLPLQPPPALCRRGNRGPVRQTHSQCVRVRPQADRITPDRCLISWGRAGPPRYPVCSSPRRNQPTGWCWNTRALPGFTAGDSPSSKPPAWAFDFPAQLCLLPRATREKPSSPGLPAKPQMGFGGRDGGRRGRGSGAGLGGSVLLRDGTLSSALPSSVFTSVTCSLCCQASGTPSSSLLESVPGPTLSDTPYVTIYPPDGASDSFYEPPPPQCQGPSLDEAGVSARFFWEWHPACPSDSGSWPHGGPVAHARLPGGSCSELC